MLKQHCKDIDKLLKKHNPFVDFNKKMIQWRRTDTKKGKDSLILENPSRLCLVAPTGIEPVFHA